MKTARVVLPPDESVIPDVSVLPRVLIVEDDLPIQDLLTYNIAREGFEVVAATSGEMALCMIQARCPDLVLLDLMLPGLDGWEVCRLLRRDPVCGAVPVLVLSARGEPEDIARAMTAGADAYLTKPFDMKELRRMARELMHKHRGRVSGPTTPGASLLPLLQIGVRWQSISRVSFELCPEQQPTSAS